MRENLTYRSTNQPLNFVQSMGQRLFHGTVILDPMQRALLNPSGDMNWGNFRSIFHAPSVNVALPLPASSPYFTISHMPRLHR